MREPVSTIGPGWRGRIFTGIPWAFRYCTDRFRLEMIRTRLGSSGAWFMRERAANIPVVLGTEVVRAAESSGRARLTLSGRHQTSSTLHVDHVIAATGYEHDVARLPFLTPALVQGMDLIGKCPRLSAYFESSVHGLYFAGPIAAHTFGPVMGCLAGCDFAARRISAGLVRALRPKRLANQPNVTAAT